MNQKSRSILLIGNFLSSSLGTRGVSEDLRLRLLARGWQVISASRRANRLLRLWDMLWVTWRFRKQYRAANVDVFSGQAFRWAEMVSFLLRTLGKKYNLTLRGGGLPDFAARHPRRVQRLLPTASSVNTPSRYLQQAFRTIRPDIQWLPNGLDLAQYHPREREYSQPRLVWLRAFHSTYQPQVAVEVLAHLRSEGWDCTLTMVGPDKHDGTYAAAVALAKDKNIWDFIQTPGAVEKAAVPAWLDQGNIFLNTTRFESFGVSVLEAAACGLPIVTTNVGELPYLWQDGVDALLVPPDDPDAMAAAVQRILTEPGLAQRLTANARQKAQSFDWAAVLPQWEELLASLSKDA